MTKHTLARSNYSFLSAPSRNQYLLDKAKDALAETIKVTGDATVIDIATAVGKTTVTEGETKEHAQQNVIDAMRTGVRQEAKLDRLRAKVRMLETTSLIEDVGLTSDDFTEDEKSKMLAAFQRHAPKKGDTKDTLRKKRENIEAVYNTYTVAAAQRIMAEREAQEIDQASMVEAEVSNA